ncbi:DUF1275 family protein [Microbacterium azadirachtae]|uniref:DUF1275 family protein n=1 Tax=Microbacterium azadirachtae TaxID=582680 RepID=UPI00089088C6|nr:DUF1275 family protein [Microbacterium azadirachtae]SDL13475.1 Uncharacterized membrane protein YoaK, UPF0700 family [Microbacterium azadirachtae]SEF43347.1 Uncharacterized membrane protein YoaK, UPF0700 family [Microbacterium azadirachtae]SEF43387.1 Uncharacterized membrane protein YoaK, UPF0700 family [Microbacterium azadirachtae]
MREVSRRGLALSLALSGVAGYVDAVGFIETGGLFVSFMSGNSTQAGVEVWADGPLRALLPLGLVVAFVAGVAAGGVVVGARARRRGVVVAGSAAAVALCAIVGFVVPHSEWRFALLAAAMGALNTLYLADGRARIAITYATGTLVSLGLALAALVTGRSSTAWRRPLLLWASLAAGAVAGAAAHRWLGDGALLAAALALAALAVAVGAAARR